MDELKDKMLEDVAGGATPAVIEAARPVKVVGEYWGTKWKENGPYTYYVGMSGLKAELLRSGTAPYRILSGGIGVGFTVAENLEFLDETGN